MPANYTTSRGEYRMKNKFLNYLLATAFLAGGGLALADDSAKTQSTSDTNLTTYSQQEKELSDLSAKTLSLEKKIATLEMQLQFKNGKTTAAKNAQPTLQGKEKALSVNKSSTQVDTDELDAQSAKKDLNIERILDSIRYAHGLVVVTSPFVGKSYSPYDLLTEVSSTNTDLLLLKERKALELYAEEHNEILPDRPVLDLSGAVEGKGIYTGGYKRTGSSSSDLNLSRVEFDVVSEIGPWATAAVMLNYEDKPPQAQSSNSPNFTLSNSRVKVDRAFLTIGNLNKFPVYFSFGQVYAPFGTYSSYLMSDTLPKILGHVKARAASLNFNKWNFLATAYLFKGDSYVTNNKIINNWGINLDYQIKPFDTLNVLRNFNLATDFGVGYIANIGDSKFLQENIFGIASNSALAPQPANFEQLQNRVPAVNAHMSLDWTPFHVFSEFVCTTTPFNVNDLSFNSHGAKPSAFEIEGTYTFNMWQQKYAFTLGYNKSWQALALGSAMPKESYATALSTSIWPFTVETLEIRHDVNYNYGDTGGSNNRNATVTVLGSDSRTQNVVTLMFGVYF